MEDPRLSVRVLCLALIVVLAPLAGCGGDDATKPEPVEVALGDLTLSLHLSKSTVSLTDTLSARVDAATDEGDSLLAGFEIAWGWGDRHVYWSSETGLTHAVVQFFTAGQRELRVRISDGEEEVALSRTVTVTVGGGPDGSLDMIRIAPGGFTRGDNYPGQTVFVYNSPRRTIDVSQFSLARTELTNATCAEALNWAVDRDLAGLSPDPRFLVWMPDSTYGEWVIILDFTKGDLTWADSVVAVPAGRELYPVTGVSWDGAATVCNWLSEMEGEETAYTFTPGNSLHLYDVICDFTSFGYRLPTEAEWEKAARGGLALPTGLNPDPDRPFPWGAEPARVELAFGIKGSVRGNVGTDQFASLHYRTVIFDGPLPVGSFPLGRGPYGHDDLLGNTAEWCNDWFGTFYYEEAPASDPTGTDEIYPGVQDFKVLRGDGWTGSYIPERNWFSVEEGCAKRRWADYHYRGRDLGFRVARSWQ